jgi:hypothetical protein
MEPAAAIGSLRLGVQRQFEANRLAKDFQARAYEQVLPLGGFFPARAVTTDQTGVGLEQPAQVSQGGVAA